MARSRSVKAHESQVEWMFHSLSHGRPIVNGYAGYFPSRFVEAKKSLLTFPGDESLGVLGRFQIRYCVVALDQLTTEEREALDREPRLQPRLHDRATNVVIYEYVGQHPGLP